ncbi:hydrogenase maturation protein [Nocardia sp. NPDC050793]|uniref:hydrogenase maturation protein n=1 Tax=Nocardia sp. NPDC050793 TaxID=3155159 RepID=UPI0033EEFBF4
MASAFNSLTQRIHAELRARDHHVGVELALGDEALRAGVAAFRPEVIVAPMLTTAIPKDIWSAYTVLIVHPGPVGDRGPSSLDWAIHDGEREWGVTVLQAVEEFDAGPVWASVPCTLAACGKSELYRNEVADAAVRAVLIALGRFARGRFEPEPPDCLRPDVRGRLRPYHDQRYRRIDWAADETAVVLRKLRAADSQPGVLDELYGREFYLHGGHHEDRLRGSPGTIVATRDGAICLATGDGAVWVPQLRPRRAAGGPPTFKRPATDALGSALPASIPEIPVTPEAAAVRDTWSELRYREEGAVGYLEFSFPGGALSTRQSRTLLAAYRQACARPIDVLVLGSARDIFCTGIHLNVIEAAADPAVESWLNITAMNEVVEAILTTTDKLVIAALAGNAAAGGVMLALAADEVWCRESVVLNPHYRLMGLHGSEYWTYLLPRRVGATEAERLTREALPVGAAAAAALGLADRVVPGDAETFWNSTRRAAARLAGSAELVQRLVAKKQRRATDESAKPLNAYRDEELARMHRDFAPGQPYHALRRDFVHKVPPAVTPPHLLG